MSKPHCLKCGKGTRWMCKSCKRENEKIRVLRATSQGAIEPLKMVKCCAIAGIVAGLLSLGFMWLGIAARSHGATVVGAFGAIAFTVELWCCYFVFEVIRHDRE